MVSWFNVPYVFICFPYIRTVLGKCWNCNGCLQSAAATQSVLRRHLHWMRTVEALLEQQKIDLT